MSLSQVRLLVIEDDEDLHRLLVAMLRAEGYLVDGCHDGEEGLYKAQNWDFDALVLDVMLPKFDGFELLRSLRRTHQTPVLMLTARDETIDRVRGLDLGADDYLTKPFEKDELLARVRAIVRRGGIAIARVIEFGGVRLDTGAMKVEVKGASVDLTPREFGMAELLMRRQGEVISRDFICDNLFDDDVDALSNMLDVYIYKLRQKLGKDFIKTRRGAGYIIE